MLMLPLLNPLNVATALLETNLALGTTINFISLGTLLCSTILSVKNPTGAPRKFKASWTLCISPSHFPPRIHELDDVRGQKSEFVHGPRKGLQRPRLGRRWAR